MFGDERRSKFAQLVHLNQEKSNMTETRRHQICADEILMLPKCLLKPHTQRAALNMNHVCRCVPDVLYEQSQKQ